MRRRDWKGRGVRRRGLGRERRGFTLLEVLLAVALGAVILTFITTYLYSMAALWGYGADDRLFKKHTRGVARFLEQSFQAAGARYLEEGQAAPVYWFDWQGDRAQRVEYLSFELEKGPGALVWPSQPLPHVVCSLDFVAGEGLYLLWRSRLEQEFEEAPPRRTLVSPFVRDLRYHYIDYTQERPQWEILREPKREANQSYVLPQRIEIVFERKGEEVTRQLLLPSGLQGVPLF